MEDGNWYYIYCSERCMDHIFNYVDTILQKKDGWLEEKLYLCRRITIISGCER